ncbi:Wzz/FepE/Etk N-terminal domain-containing protein, partial [Escherichia coli]|uniref:Wzz/FepE/Etk N-terminal domain-containing protein n=1 Tax=Escherichia coli TaxID=562 RepID=UPI0021C5DABB
MSSVKNRTVEKEADEIDLGRLVGELIDHRKLIISVTALFTLIALLYALFATPIYQADALLQVEQKQGNAILNSLSQMLPDSQPQSAPEIALLQSRMILGKTVDDLNLQAKIEQSYFPLLGKGWARLVGEKKGILVVSRLYLSSDSNTEIPKLKLKVKDANNYIVTFNDHEFEGKVGVLLDSNGISLKVDSIEAKPGTEFVISYVSKLQAITDLQEIFSVADQGKDTGILSLSLTGPDPLLLEKTLNSISNNYLAQNVARQAAQDAKEGAN